MEDRGRREHAQAKAQESATQLKTSVEELMSSERNLLVHGPNDGSGLQFWLLRDPSDVEGFRMVATGGEKGRLSDDAVGFAASKDRPKGYPSDLPFVEDSAVVINPSGSSVRMHWIDSHNALLALRSVVAECEEMGWKRRDDAPIELASRVARYIEMTKGTRIRIAILRIYGNGGVLEMLEDEE